MFDDIMHIHVYTEGKGRKGRVLEHMRMMRWWSEGKLVDGNNIAVEKPSACVCVVWIWCV